MNKCKKLLLHILLTDPVFETSGTTHTSAAVLPCKNHNTYRRELGIWSNACRKAKEILLVAMHLGTEIATYNIPNAVLAHRSLYLAQGTVMIIYRYLKSRALRGSTKPVLRFMDDDTSEKFKIYLVLVRASKAPFTSLLYGEGEIQTIWETFFTSREKRVHADIVRQVIPDTMKSSGYPILFNDLRHHATGIFPILSGTTMTTLIERLLPGVQDNGHEQAGHLSRVSQRNYGTTNSQLR